MRNLVSRVTFHGIPLPRMTIRLVLIVLTVTAFFGMLSIDSSYNNLEAQTTQQKCIPDMGTNISKSNCFSNAASAPVYNMTSTENARPPPPPK